MQFGPPAASPDLPSDWVSAAARITAGGVRRILLLGPRDAGKSTFCSFLLRHAAQEGCEVTLLDADPAQKLVGPPACATLGRGTIPPALAALAFVGTLDPLRGWRRLTGGVSRLVAETSADALLVVNTSGLLAGAGRRLKAAKIAAVRPELLIALGEDPDMEAVLADHATIPSLRLARSPLARRKGEGERRRIRRNAFRQYFAAVPTWTVDLRALWLEGEPSGAALLDPWRLVALADAARRDQALGLVLGAEALDRVLLRAPKPERPVAGLRWGPLRLDEDYAGRRSGPTPA